jgi:hypothetical protein
MYQDEVVKLEIVLENIQGTYTHPEHLKVLSELQLEDPTHHQVFTMINGEVNQKKSYTYLLLPEADRKI